MTSTAFPILVRGISEAIIDVDPRFRDDGMWQLCAWLASHRRMGASFAIAEAREGELMATMREPGDWNLPFLPSLEYVERLFSDEDKERQKLAHGLAARNMEGFDNIALFSPKAMREIVEAADDLGFE